MSQGRRRIVASLLVVLLGWSLVAPAAGAAAGAGTRSSPGGGADARSSPAVDRRAAGPDDLAPRQVDADDVLMRISLQPDGDAVWTVAYRVRLATDNETAAFRTLRDDIRENPSNFTGRFRDRMRSIARAAENATGREMAVRNLSVSARIQSVPTYGIVTYRFTWTNFAAVDGRRLRAGDAISGLFLDERTRLQMRWPAAYDLVSVTPDPASRGDRSVTWSGPTEFGSDQPRLVVRKPGPLSGLWPLLVGAAALVVLLAGGTAAWRYRDRLPVGAPGGGGPSSESPEASAGDGAEGAEGREEPPEELLSNEERVLRFVEQQGGRVKQQEIVDEMDWTEAKTSQVVRDLREEGKLEGFRLGRENVLRLPEVDESSPLDEGE